MTTEQEQALIDYIRANDDNQYYNHSPEPDHCGHVHCTYHGLCFILEMRTILNGALPVNLTDAEFVRTVLDMYGDYRGLTELGNVPAWKAESWATSPAGVQIPHPLPNLCATTADTAK